MKCRLKNKELQAKLEAIDSKFGERLSLYFDSCDGETSFSLLGDSEDEFSLTIYNSAIEEVHEYDPKAWNKWPEVLPPKRVYYRVEYKEDNLTKKAAWMWNGLCWQVKPDTYLLLLDCANKEGIRFKPWDDPDPDEDDEEEE